MLIEVLEAQCCDLFPGEVAQVPDHPLSEEKHS